MRSAFRSDVLIMRRKGEITGNVHGIYLLARRSRERKGLGADRDCDGRGGGIDTVKIGSLWESRRCQPKGQQGGEEESKSHVEKTILAAY